MNNEIREPVQKRSIEKKQRIIETGFKLICEEGYYNTNTAEIAKASSVSTGIVYQYFKDKKDILLEGIKLYAKDIFYPTFRKNKIDKDNLYSYFTDLVDEFISNHKKYKKAHEALTLISHSDLEFSKEINKLEMDASQSFVEILKQNDFNNDNLKEKVHIIMHLMEDLCHEIVFHKHNNMDYDIMKKETINIMCYILDN